MKFSLLRLLVITAWFSLALCLLRINGCDAQGISDEIAEHTYSDEEREAWWRGWHDFDTEVNPYNVTNQRELWDSHYNGVSTRGLVTAGGVVGMVILFAAACTVPLTREKHVFVHDWQI